MASAGNTALHYSVAAGDAKAVRKLLSYKASARVKNALGKTPYYLACEGGNRAIAQLLMQADADPNLNGKLRTALRPQTLSKTIVQNVAKQ